MGDPIKVLLIEDNEADASLIGEYLGDQRDPPFSLEPVSRLSEALDRLARGGYDAVLSDLGLPDSAGLETLRTLRRQAPDLPVVVFTVENDRDQAVAAVHEGAQDFLVKNTLTGEILVRSLCYALERKKLETALRRSESSFRSMLNAIGESALLITPGGKVLDANETVARRFGLTCDQLRGKDVYGFLPDEVREGRRAAVDRVAATGQAVRFEDTRFGRRMLNSIYPVLNEDRQVVSLAVVGLDITERQQAEEELRATYDLLAGFIARSPVYAFIKEVSETESRSLYVSDNFVDMVGIPVAAMRGKTMRDLFPADLAETMTQDDLAVVRDQRSLELEEELNGRTYVSTKFPLAVGGKTYLAGYTWDVTESKRTEAALRESEGKHRRLVQNLHAGVVVHAADTRILLANDQASVLLGLTPDQLRGKAAPDPAWRFFREDGTTLPLDEYPVNRVAATGAKVTNQVIGVHRPSRGDVVWVLADAFPETDSGGALERIVVTFIDITERIQAETKLWEVSTAMAQSIDGIAFLGLDERIRFANGAWARMHGYRVEELTGQTLELFHTAEQLEKEVGPAVEQVRTSGRFEGEIGHRRKDGSVFPAYMSTTLVRNAEGTAIGILGVARDITDRKAAEAEKARLQVQLAQFQKMESVGRLAGGVAHDFNNMLGAILGNAELALLYLGSGEPPAEKLQAKLLEIIKAAKHSAGLTRQLLAFARKQAILPRRLDLNGAVEDLLKMLRHLIGENVDLVWHPGGGLPSVWLDPSQVDQILVNLCVNARDAITGPGTVTLETKAVTVSDQDCGADKDLVPGDYVVLTVSDTGCGMDEEVQAQIFEPFFTTKDLGKGTGLGLATVFGIVKQNKGFITVRSRVGQGTRFQVYLPRMEASSAAPGASSPAPAAEPGRGTVLLVEDEPSLREITGTMLRELGYAVLAAPSPEEALDLLRAGSGRVDLVLTDLVMPGMNGKELVSAMKKEAPQLKICLMSGYADTSVREIGGAGDPPVFLQKPFTLAELSEKVRSAIQGGQP